MSSVTASFSSNRLLHDDMKESGLLSVLSRLMRSFNARLQPRSHAVDIIQVQAAAGSYTHILSASCFHVCSMLCHWAESQRL